MFNQGGLSLDQAPPVSVVFGFFLLGSVFGILGGISILYFPHTLFDPASIGAVVTTHLLALGTMMSFMLGALFQMLPVVAGIVLDAPIPRSRLIMALLTAGVVTLSTGFITHLPMLYLFASIFLGASLLYISWTMLLRLSKLSHQSASSRGMLFALLGMLAFLLLALYMTTTYAQMHEGNYFLQVKQMHYSFALFGWVSLLILSISFQTVEMFYVTPTYPKPLSRYAPLALFTLLLVLSLSIALGSTVAIIFFQGLIYLLLTGYAVTTLLRLSQRKRPLADATIWFWRMGMGSLIGSMLTLFVDLWTGTSQHIDIAAILFLSFVFSVLFAMFYKIVPFLTWFHLNAQGYFTAPMMHEVIHPKTAKKHFWIHGVMVASLLLAIPLPTAIYLSGVLMMLSFGWIAYQILHANRLYRHTQETGEKFDMQMGASA